jgi:hypothetical protein
MKTHPIEAAAVAAVAIGRLVRAVTVPVVALALTVAGYRPAAPAAVAAMVADCCLVAGCPVAVPTPAAALTVVQLRQLARQAGHRALARSGRRADLLAALGA